ncbi:MAG: hypothetical protein JWN50_88 [Parcubacteria group bacterium]|nr:hypothetical protein [Parcubacteria group bacterium]
MKTRFAVLALASTLVLGACTENNVFPTAPDAKASDSVSKVMIIDPVDNRTGQRPDSYNHNVVMVTAPAGYVLPSVQTTLEGDAIRITQVNPEQLDIVDCGTPCTRSTWRIEVYYYVNNMGPSDPDRHSKVTVTLSGVPGQKAVFEVSATNKG